jgi:hypothetical protein
VRTAVRDDESTATNAGGPSTTVTVALPPTTSSSTVPPTTVPAGPAVAEAGGVRIVITAPTALATIGPSFDLCYEVTGTAPSAQIAFEVSLVFVATGTLASRFTVDASAGRGSARVNLGTPEPRRYDMPIQALVNGQPVSALAVIVRGVNIASAAPAGCP